MTTYIISTMQLPWSFADDDVRFKKILSIAMVIFLAVTIPITVIKLPELARKEKADLPPQLARVMLEKQELPPPKLIEPPKEETLPREEQKTVEKLPENKPVTNNTNKPLENAKSAISKGDVVANAKAQAQAQIATFKDDLMEMREALQTTAVETASTTVSNGAGQATQVDRSMINSGQTKGSGGINVGAYASHEVGGVVLSGRETTKVKSGLAEASKKAATTAGGGNNDNRSSRSGEEIRKVMDQNSSALFSIYNRALRENATLKGDLVVQMVIDSSGRILEATIISSELKNSELEAKILSRIKSITFPASNVEKTTIPYTFKFSPH